MLFVPIAYLVMSTLSPGPVTVLTIKNTTQHGRSAGTAVALGGAATTSLFIVLALLLSNNHWLNVTLHTANIYQQVGAVFILIMGFITGYKSLFTRDAVQETAVSSNQLVKSFFVGMGLMMPYLPQAILFYTVILPHHATVTNLSNLILFMGGLKVVLTVGWYTLLAAAAKSIHAWFFNARIQRILEFAVACFLVGIGLTLLVQ